MLAHLVDAKLSDLLHHNLVPQARRLGFDHQILEEFGVFVFDLLLVLWIGLAE